MANYIILDSGHAKATAGKRSPDSSLLEWEFNNAMQYKLKEAAGMNFDSEGFGKIDGRYVIACTTTFGNVGDYIDFVQEDGSVLIPEALRPYMGGKTIITPKK